MKISCSKGGSRGIFLRVNWCSKQRSIFTSRAKLNYTRGKAAGFCPPLKAWLFRCLNEFLLGHSWRSCFTLGNHTSLSGRRTSGSYGNRVARR